MEANTETIGILAKYMEKYRKEIIINYNLDWKYDVEISKIRKDLDAIEKLGATHVQIEAKEEYGYPILSVNPITIRMETDDEYKKRIYKEKKQLEDVIKEQLRQLERLKLKYGIK